jgi:hypothetical protein
LLRGEGLDELDENRDDPWKENQRASPGRDRPVTPPYRSRAPRVAPATSGVAAVPPTAPPSASVAPSGAAAPVVAPAPSAEPLPNVDAAGPAAPVLLPPRPDTPTE